MSAIQLTRLRLLRRSAAMASPAPPPPKPSSTESSWWRRTWDDHHRPIIIGALVLLGLALAWGRVDLERVHAWAEHVDPRVLFLALVLLPLVTFPVTPLNVIAGIRFGLEGGLAMVAGAIIAQHTLAFLGARILPKMLKRRLEPLQRRLPRHAHVDASVFASLLPGAPYWAQLYVLPLVGIPFATYLLVSVPLHIIRSITAVIAGRMSDDLSWGWAIALVVYSICLIIACFLAGRRMKRKYGENQAPKTSE
ncbi:hypothetical protein [Synoicihabitans lomoniglobus]|uniref:TVP38/TMEM64 family membrane protein n=1 Tax=Synoicihabitans lomoniglobus TaxID=2909285 RepID=A0AAF0CMW3_9BACT|nr:VTT domain-containing protein [Opitutaceae bacterium LMO-M01]WED64713.1 hypothetical protein PXH66_20405 [Opitutaceae bacterium LMO-M01]